MKTPERPTNEAERLSALEAMELLDTPAEERFDRVTRLAASLFDVPIALVSLVDKDRQWFKSCYGLGAKQTGRDISFCGHSILGAETFVVEDALKDERFADNPLVTGDPKIRFYAGAPLKDRSGYRMGTLCIIDRKPRILTPSEQNSLRDLADIIEREFQFRELGSYFSERTKALNILNDIALESTADLSLAIVDALAKANRYLGTETAIVSEVTGDAYTVLWHHQRRDHSLENGLTLPLDETYCSILLEKGEVLGISHMARSVYRDRACYAAFGLESYIAAPIWIDDELFGTVNFSSPKPRPLPFSETEKMFVNLLARWVGDCIQQARQTETLEKLVSNTPGMLYQYRRWPDGHSSFPFASDRIREIYDVESEQVREDAGIVFEKLHPDDLDGISRSIEQSAETLCEWHSQYRVHHKDKGWRWVEGKASPELLADGSIIWHGYIADVDEKKKIELALKESEDELRRLYELSPIGISLNDYASGRFLDVNDAFLVPTGLSREQLHRMAVLELVPEDKQPRAREIISELQETGRFGPCELELLDADARPYPVVIRGMQITSVSGRSLVWSLVEDISERKKVEKMKNEFISTVSHELRTPLTAISGSLGLIAGGALGQLTEPVERIVNIAHRNSDHLRQLVDDLLDIEKLVSGKMRMHLAHEPIRPLVHEVMERLNSYAQGRHITLRFDQNDNPDPHANVDRSRLAQALTNLLSNAIKFSPENSAVWVRLRCRQAHLVIEVQDQGPGIPDSFRARIFEKFAQADSSDTRGKGGTGLGLAITREIMTQMGGSVGFDSLEGQGARFWLALPEA
ncbi:ATP-binding protein [Marinobacter sp. VGCF2001]|uniref:GAF domain-containing sensor histidine kinase n=1 Tax=Marinobacter sp. VGCF2001 TaxID=3417189 RepID=UPI003CF814E6